jgi:hypothetical protein
MGIVTIAIGLLLRLDLVAEHRAHRNGSSYGGTQGFWGFAQFILYAVFALLVIAAVAFFV